MRYYAPYIAALIVIIFMGLALFHQGSRFKGRDYKYGNPARERMIQECAHINTAGQVVKYRLYMGSDGSGGAIWYSVTMQKEKQREKQIFAAFDRPAVDRIRACDSFLSMICGSTSINIPMEDMDKRTYEPLVYYMGEQKEGSRVLSDEI